MKTIFETFKKSIYGPSFYQNAAGAPFATAFRYYVKFSLFLSIVLTIYLALTLVPAGVAFVKNRAPDLVKSYYDKTLVVKIERGVASADVPMPYFVPLKSTPGESTSMQNMLVIDTTKEFDRKKFEEYKTYALLTKTDIITTNDNDQITIKSLRTLPSITVSQDVLLSLVQKINDSMGYIVSFGVLATFLVVFSGYFVYLIPLLLFSLVPKVVAYLKKTPLTYASAYRMSLYAIIPALAVKTLLNIMGVFFLPEYFTLLVFMLVIAVNMRDAEEEPTLFT